MENKEIINDALNHIPEGMINVAKKDHRMVILIAQSIARKKGMEYKDVIKHLDSVNFKKLRQ